MVKRRMLILPSKCTCRDKKFGNRILSKYRQWCLGLRKGDLDTFKFDISMMFSGSHESNSESVMVTLFSVLVCLR